MNLADLYPELVKAHRATNARAQRLVGGGTKSPTTLALRAIKPTLYLTVPPRDGSTVTIGKTKYVSTKQGLRRIRGGE